MTTNPYTHQRGNLPAQPLLLPARVSMNYPQVHKLYPQPLKPVKMIFTEQGMVTSADNVYRRRMIDLGQAVYLTGRSEQIVSIKPAKGELFRQPGKFIAVVMNEQGHKRDVELRNFTPLSVR